MSRILRLAVCLALSGALSACSVLSARSDADGGAEPAMRWDHVPGAPAWTAAGFAALDSHAAILPTLVPEDIEDWCPGYEDADMEDRRAFWVGLISALAEKESTWQPDLVTDGLYHGLVQIYPPTARFNGCEAQTGAALTNGAANIRCAFRIWARTVARDNRVAAGNRGVAADWGPMHSSQSHKREDIRGWVSQQAYCRP